MVGEYYELPIRFRNLLSRNGSHPKCELKRSIAQNVFLIISSKYRENRYDETYGCEIWDMDFEVVPSESGWVEKVRKSVMASVQRHEKRLEDLKVTVTISLDEYTSPLSGTKGVKRKLTIMLKGRMTETGEDFAFSTNIFTSPLSLE
jgi:phage baseplate assembly protein W